MTNNANVNYSGNKVARRSTTHPSDLSLRMQLHCAKINVAINYICGAVKSSIDLRIMVIWIYSSPRSFLEYAGQSSSWPAMWCSQVLSQLIVIILNMSLRVFIYAILCSPIERFPFPEVQHTAHCKALVSLNHFPPSRSHQRRQAAYPSSQRREGG